MGCIASKKVFTVNPLVEGQDEPSLQVMYELGLSKRDIDVLYTAFWDMDADESGTIVPAELFSYFEVESTTYEKQVFCLFDEDLSGIINFMEFVCSLWNILTLDESNMGGLAFMIMDPTGSKSLNYSDIQTLLEMMHKKKIEKDPGLRDMMGYIKKDLNRAITIKDFTEWCHKYPSVLTPLRMLQTHLRFQIIGPNFWTKMTEKRRSHPEMGKYDFLPQLQQRVIAQTKFFINQGNVDIVERKRQSRRGKGPNGDHRDNITRKQSLLVSYFQLSRYSLRQPRAQQVVPVAAKSTDNTEAGPAAVVEKPSLAPRRRRSSLMFGAKPVLIIKSEMPVDVVKGKKSGKTKKKELYKETAMSTK